MIDFKSKRHQQYKKYWDVYNNEPQFKRTKGKYIPIALGMELAKLYRDLSFAQNINASVKDDDDVNRAIDRLIFENELNQQLSESAITVAVAGGVVFKNYLDRGQSKITYIQPEYYFPEFDKFDKRKVIKETIAFPYNEGKERYLYQEIYAKRDDGYYWCITKQSFYNNNELGADVGKVNEVNTYLTESPLTYVPFSRQNGDFFGHSIFFGLEPLFEELNWRISQISKILDKHSNPNITGSVSLLDNEYRFKMGDEGLFIPVEDGETKPEYLTWESQLKANFEFIDNVLMKALHYLSPLNANLYGLSTESNSSALEVKIKAFRASAVIENSLKYWQQAIKKILLQAQHLDVLAGNGSYAPSMPNIEIAPSMPEDSFTKAQEEQLKVVSGVTSIKSAIARLNPEYSAEQVNDEFLEIINEENERQRLSFMADEIDFDITDKEENE